jgi:hypothetical protein
VPRQLIMSREALGSVEFSQRKRSQLQLVVVTGPPGTGKSTVAEYAARLLRCPVFSKDWERGMLVGLARTGQTPVLLDPFDRSLDNANLVIVAPAGAGKSFFCKLHILRQLINGTDCIVVDPENEYSRVAEAAGGQVVRLAASSSHRINPFDLPLPAEDVGGDGDRAEEDPLAERVTVLLGLLEVIPHLVQIFPHGRYSRRVDPIDAPRAFSVIDDQAGLLEHLQVLGHGGSAHRHDIRELAHGARTSDESLKDGAPGGIAERLEGTAAHDSVSHPKP